MSRPTREGDRDRPRRGAVGEDRDAEGFRRDAKKSLGQNFLHERTVIEKILLAVDPRPGDRIVEIGPGQGALTLPLLDRHGMVTAIEFDRDLLVPLAVAAAPHGALTLLHADVLTVDFGALAAGDDVPAGGRTEGGGTGNAASADRRLRLVGNLPYYLSSPILFHALDHAAAVRDMHFMLQKEVVDRMAAGPGSKVYGRLSVMLQAECVVTPLFKVPPGAFRPAPKVDSAVVRLVPRPPGAAGIADRARFAAIVRAAFGQRRKTLRNALSGLLDAAAIEAAGLRPEVRAEQVPVEGFVRLANLAEA